ncbi:hypothetical protein OS493_026001 [Desmophyllum pertusum]|uniref:Uncharacterized protein n=1 Tax=Desmophyllum pertusum TaxID=174260 RepID=A0A9W9YL66_9CNID|nr:hypothetical protein OS493_026001 [Desmophyllum pertusum]
MSSFLPSIDNVGKSSLVAAKRIYSEMQYVEEAANNGRSGKKRPGHKKSRKRLNPPSTNHHPHQKVERTKEYSRQLKSRREKARIAREESLAESKNQEELKQKGLREKKRLNQLFSVYAAQQGPSYRDSAKVVKPKFPILIKVQRVARFRERKFLINVAPFRIYPLSIDWTKILTNNSDIYVFRKLSNNSCELRVACTL